MLRAHTRDRGDVVRHPVFKGASKYREVGSVRQVAACAGWYLPHLSRFSPSTSYWRADFSPPILLAGILIGRPRSRVYVTMRKLVRGVKKFHVFLYPRR